MFINLATMFTPALTPAQAADFVLTTFRPSQLNDFLELFWRQGVADPALLLGVAAAVPDHQDQARPLASIIDPSVLSAINFNPPISWQHLVYAYMVEQTRIVDIFRRIVAEYATGERLPQVSQATQRWLRCTEELFFTAPQPFSVRSVTSSLRPDEGAVRRNAYYRMLGMDLTHGMDDGRPYPYVKPAAANRDFVTLFEALLTEVWKGHINRFNFFNENRSDATGTMTLVQRLMEMLQARRHQGMLSREEFNSVALTSWLRLTVSQNTQVVTDLSASAGGETDRLKKIGELVGLSAHARTSAYFQLAQPMSNILRGIENGAVLAAGATGLFNGLFTNDMLAVITNWSIATGRDLKDPAGRQPLPSVLVEAARSTGGNGRHVPVARIPAGMLR